MIVNNIKRSINLKKELLEDKLFLKSFDSACLIILNSYRNNGRLLIIGNGGSAADAQHLAAEFVSKLAKDREPLPALALTVDTSMITAIGNDYGFDQIFSRQLKANANHGDVLLAISTSGKSENIINCARHAQKMGIKVIGLTGANVGNLDKNCDILLKVPSTNTAAIQECHILIEHSLCEHIENKIFQGE
jgi:D-sedoheptulose 7-phosphate isomerase